MSALTKDFPTRAEVERAADRYVLVLPRDVSAARAGEMAGRRSGSSVEFQDRKDFAPGDDLRHVDWRGFARSDRMTVKLYREEISPRADIIIDGSASMGSTDKKALRTVEAAWLMWVLASKLRATVKTWMTTGSAPIPLNSPLDLLHREPLAVENPLAALPHSPLSRPGGIRVIITDLLYPLDPAQLDPLLHSADRLYIIQVLSEFEADPSDAIPSGALMRLENAESSDYLDVHLTPSVVSQYKERLAKVQADIVSRLRRHGGASAVVRENDSLDAVCRNLTAAGIISP